MKGLREATTRQEYDAAFEAERARTYPVVTELEARFGFAVDTVRLEAAARVLACPVKANPPNWQHGRVLYAVARALFADRHGERFTVLDIGTAKGFSALCLLWALQDSGAAGTVISVDVLDPDARILRNTSAEVDGLKTLGETLAPWPEAQQIHFEQATGLAWLRSYGRDADTSGATIQFAFVDGKHSGQVVSQEAEELSRLQRPGDTVVFDDVHLPDVWSAVRSCAGYDLERIDVLPNRAYAVAVRR